MPAFTRWLLTWLVGYPLSVLAASAVLAAVFLADAVAKGSGEAALHAGLKQAALSLPGIASMVALWGLAPAALSWWHEREHPTVASYLRDGLRTGLWAGIFFTCAFVVVAVIGAFQIPAALWRSETEATKALEAELGLVATIGVLLALFGLAGATGGLVFGATARCISSRVLPVVRSAFIC